MRIVISIILLGFLLLGCKGTSDDDSANVKDVAVPDKASSTSECIPENATMSHFPTFQSDKLYEIEIFDILKVTHEGEKLIELELSLQGSSASTHSARINARSEEDKADVFNRLCTNGATAFLTTDSIDPAYITGVDSDLLPFEDDVAAKISDDTKLSTCVLFEQTSFYCTRGVEIGWLSSKAYAFSVVAANPFETEQKGFQREAKEVNFKITGKASYYDETSRRFADEETAIPTLQAKYMYVVGYSDVRTDSQGRTSDEDNVFVDYIRVDAVDDQGGLYTLYMGFFGGGNTSYERLIDSSTSELQLTLNYRATTYPNTLDGSENSTRTIISGGSLAREEIID